MEQQRKVTVLVAALALAVGILIPVAVWAGVQTFDDVPDTDWAFDDVEWLVAAGLTTGCSVSPPLYCPDAGVTRREFAAFTHRTADKLISQVHAARNEGGGLMPAAPGTLTETSFMVPESSSLTINASVAAGWAGPVASEDVTTGGPLGYSDIVIWLQLDNTTCGEPPGIWVIGTVAPEGTEPLNTTVSLVDAMPIAAGAHTLTLCGVASGDPAFQGPAAFIATVTPDFMGSISDTTPPEPGPAQGQPRR